MSDTQSLLRIQDLRVNFVTYEGESKVLNGVSLQVNRGDILGLVGESGCGKTVTTLSITGLLNSPPAREVSGSAFFLGDDLMQLVPRARRRLCARRIAMVFQDPNSNLDPLLTIGAQLTEAILCRRGLGSLLALSPLGNILPVHRRARDAALSRGIELLTSVGIADASNRLRSYPGEFSGGMRQRALIAMALGGDPELFIADEPTTDLDVSTQSQVMRLVKGLVDAMGVSVLWVTHNLGVVARLCNRVAVMYAGNVVEDGPTRAVFRRPRHPYTVGLLEATPRRSRDTARLAAIPGSLPDLVNPPPGCRFHPRCSHAMHICAAEPFPPSVQAAPMHWVACHLYRDHESNR